jgi:diketogulonate reductase-like aldo/keto reductase
MTILTETYTLSNGVDIPKLGLGTWFIDDGKAADAVRAAVEIGYRNIDTAQAYGNERGVGEGVRTSGVPRDDLFVSTKLAAEIKDSDGAAAAIDGSLQTLGLEYIDLMLIHSPQPWDDFRGGDYADGNRQAWRALEEAHESGRILSIGVSNFQGPTWRTARWSRTSTSCSCTRATPPPSFWPTARKSRFSSRRTRRSPTARSWRTPRCRRWRRSTACRCRSYASATRCS